MSAPSKSLETCLRSLRVPQIQSSSNTSRYASQQHTFLARPLPFPAQSRLMQKQQGRRLHTSTSHAKGQQQQHDTTSSPNSPSSSRFTYRLAASFCGKQHGFNPSAMFYTFSSTTNIRRLSGQPLEKHLARPKARMPSGQDACFVSPLGDSGVALGLADGVGGWADQGIDPSDFSHGLCERMASESEKFGKDKEEGQAHMTWPTDLPRRILQNAYDDLAEDESVKGGGSTACLGVVDWWGRMTAANLGDSGFTHIRLPTLHHVSPHQTHAFNTPYQLSQIPAKLRRQMTEFGGRGPLGDQPRDAAVSIHTLQHGDIVIFATDGVWDNLFEDEILNLVTSECKHFGVMKNSASSSINTKALVSATKDREVYQQSADQKLKREDRSLQAAIATSIVQASKASGENEKRDGPFAKAVQKAYPYESWHGGKADDISVVVLIALEESKIDAASAKL